MEIIAIHFIGRHAVVNDSYRKYLCRHQRHRCQQHRWMILGTTRRKVVTISSFVVFILLSRETDEERNMMFKIPGYLTQRRAKESVKMEMVRYGS